MKQKGLSNGRKVEKDVHKLSIKPRNKRTGRIDCNTLLNLLTHAEGNCPDTELEHFECQKTGHFSGSKACKKKKD